jgi:ribosome-associated protein
VSVGALFVGASVIPESAMTIRAVRSSGPGGQNVNKVSSKVELRVDLAAIVGMDAQARTRLFTICKNDLDAEGKLLVVSQLTRDQRRNIDDAREKVRALVARAIERPVPRRKTKPSRASQNRRIEEKKRRGRDKQLRKKDY